MMTLHELRDRFRWPSLYIGVYDECTYQSMSGETVHCCTRDCPYFLITGDTQARICTLSLKDGDIAGYPAIYSHAR